MSMTPMQRMAHILRGMRLLQLADTAWFARLYWKSRPENARFRREHPDVPVPPMGMLYDIQGSCDVSGFYNSGRDSAREMARLIREHTPVAAGPLKVLEWGCGPARVLQHLARRDEGDFELYGSDYNAQTIEWCSRHFDGITFLNNGLHPPIPLASGSLDVFYCISVFTHLSEQSHYQWISEIERLLKPGGLFIGTFHGTHFRDQLTAGERDLFDKGEFVVRDKIREGKKNFSAYHSDALVRRLLASFASVEKRHMPDGFHQTVWTAVKKS